MYNSGILISPNLLFVLSFNVLSPSPNTPVPTFCSCVRKQWSSLFFLYLFSSVATGRETTGLSEVSLGRQPRPAQWYSLVQIALSSISFPSGSREWADETLALVLPILNFPEDGCAIQTRPSLLPFDPAVPR